MVSVSIERKEIVSIINLDGSRVRVQPIDIDHDGDTKDVADVTVSRDSGLQNIVQPTELGETLKELNRDEIEAHTGMSGIDMKSRLHYIEVASILAMDTLVALRVLPSRCLAFTRQKKRLAVSVDGLGRKEMVEVVGRKHEEDRAKANSSMGGMQGAVKSFMGM